MRPAPPTPSPVPGLGWRTGFALAASAFGIRAAVVLAAAGAPPSGFAAAAVGALVPVLMAALSARVFRRRGLALATGAVAAVLPGFVFFASGSWPEPPGLVLLLSSAFLLLVAADRPSSNFAVLSGAALGAAVWTHSSALIVVPFLAAPLFDRRYPRRINAHVVASAILGLLLVLAPLLAEAALSGRRPDSRGSFFPMDPAPGPSVIAAAAILGPLAAIGLARAERRGCAWVCIGLLAASLLARAVPGTLGPVGTPLWQPILLLYGAYGAASLAKRARELETEAA